MFLSYTLCLAPIHSNDISKAKEYSWNASMQYIEGNYLEAALLFQKSLEFREKETPMYSTLYKLRLYSLWNHSKDHFCSEVVNIPKSELNILRGDSSLTELLEECY